MAKYRNGLPIISTFENNGIVVRICNKCHKEYPLTSEYFHRDKSSGGGFKYHCKQCVHIPDKRHVGKDYKRCSDCGTAYPWINEFFYKANARWNGLNTICKKCSNKRTQNRVLKIKDTLEYKTMRKRIREKRHKTKGEELKEWQNQNYHKKYDNDIKFKLLVLLRQRVRNALNGEVKDETTAELLGCNIDFFKDYIADMFLDGMSWDNHGRGDGMWHLDHIKPCAMFDLTNPLQRKECFHYTNFQPLWEKDNLTKFSFYNGVLYKKISTV